MQRTLATKRLAQYQLSALSGDEKMAVLLDFWRTQADDFSNELSEFLRRHEFDELESYRAFFDPVITAGLAERNEIFNNRHLQAALGRFEPTQTVEGDEKQAKTRCPCCRFYTLSADAFHEVCPVCLWQNDGSAARDYSSANRSSLFDYQQQFWAAHDAAALAGRYIR